MKVIEMRQTRNVENMYRSRNSDLMFPNINVKPQCGWYQVASLRLEAKPGQFSGHRLGIEYASSTRHHEM
jgi:hypothetical protein